jgi:ABC-2 type transport system ATP-binding protein
MIEVKNLSKKFKSYKKEAGILGSIKSIFNRTYETKYAVRGFDLKIEANQIIGLLGPNGAGKTTLMKMMTGIIIPSEGEITINSYHPYDRKKEFRKKMALVMGQKSQLWWDIPAMDSFILLQKYYEISDIDFNKKIKDMSQLLNVAHLLHIHVRKLSLGERMKLELMASLLHSPDVLFLDEPTIGLDLIAQENIRKFIKRYATENEVTIIITSHYMADVQELCERLVLIFDGRKGFDGSVEEFENLLGTNKSVTFSFEESIDPKDIFFKDLETNWSRENREVEILLPASELREKSCEILTKYPVLTFQTEKLPIEKVMKKIMENPELICDV